MAVTTADINSLTSSIENLVKSMSNQSRFSTRPQGAGGDNASRKLERREKDNIKLYENIVNSTRNSAQALKEIEKISKKENKLSLRVIHANTELEKVMEKAYEDGKSGRKILERLPKHFKDSLEKLDKKEKDEILGIDFKSISATINDKFDIQDSINSLKSVIDDMKLKEKDESFQECFKLYKNKIDSGNLTDNSFNAQQADIKENIDSFGNSVINASSTIQQAFKENEEDNKKNIDSFGDSLIDTSSTIHRVISKNIDKFGDSLVDTSSTIQQAFKENEEDNKKNIDSFGDSLVDTSSTIHRVISKNIDKFGDNVIDTSSTIQQAVKENIDSFGNSVINASSTIQQAVKENEEDNKKNIDSFGNSVINASSTIQQAVKENAHAQSVKENADDMNQTFEENKKSVESHFNSYIKRLKKLGINFDDLMKTSRSYEEVVEKLEKASIALTKATNKAAKKSGGGMGGMLSGGKKIFTKIMGGIAGIVGSWVVQGGIEFAKKFADEVGTQMKFGYSIPMKEFPDIALKFGMNIKEASEFLGNQRDIMNARNLGEEKYREILDRNADSLINFTGSLSESTKAFADNMRFVHRFGDATIDTEAAAKRQIDMFENLRALGVNTTEKMNDLKESILSNEGNMVTLAALQRDQREEFVLGIQKQHEYYLALGFNIEQTKRATAAISALAKKSPLERMKQGATLGAMMGMAGMGAEGARMQDYMKRFHTLDKSEKEDLYRMKTEVANRFTQMYGEQQGGIMFEQMAHQYGFADEFATLESGTKEGLAADKERAEEEQKRHHENTGKFTKMVGAMESIKAASESSVGLLGMIALKAADKISPEWVSDIEKFAGDIIGKANQGLGTAIGKIIGTPQSKIQDKIGIKENKINKLREKITGYGEQLAGEEKKYNKKAIETGKEIASAKGYRKSLLVSQLEGTHEAYQKDKETIEEKIQEALEELDRHQKEANDLQKEANELQKKANKSAKETEENTGVSADADKEKKNKEQDWRKMYQMKISRVSSSPTN